MNATDLREKDPAQLQNELEALLKEQFNLRMQLGSGNTPKIHRFSIVRHDIARIKTVLIENAQISKVATKPSTNKQAGDS